jgi:CRISPR/Cas system-associated exonuclease Cas4 (RecB family)
MDINKDPVAKVYAFLDHQNQAEFDNWKPPKYQTFRASEAGDCLRKIYYRLSGAKPDSPFSAFGKIITHDGDVNHDVVRWQMKMAGVELFDLDFNEETGAVTETNYKVVPVEHDGTKFDVTFRADGGVMIDGVPHSLEIKSIDGFSYKYIDEAYQRGELWDYLRRTDKGYNKYHKFFYQSAVTSRLSGLDHVYLVIKNRSMGEIGFGGQNQELAFKVLDADYDHAMSGFAAVRRALDKGELPMQEYTEKSKPCSLCPWAKTCWGRGT